MLNGAPVTCWVSCRSDTLDDEIKKKNKKLHKAEVKRISFFRSKKNLKFYWMSLPSESPPAQMSIPVLVVVFVVDVVVVILVIIKW